MLPIKASALHRLSLTVLGALAIMFVVSTRPSIGAPLSIEETLNTRQFGYGEEPQLSPSGALLLYQVCRRVVQANGSTNNDCDVVVRDIHRKLDVRVSREPGEKSYLAWSPSGGTIAYLGQAGDANDVFVTDPSGTERDLGPARMYSQMRWLDENHLVCFDKPRSQGSAASKSPLLEASTVTGSTATIYRSIENLSSAESSTLSKSVSDAPTWTYPASDLVVIDVRSGLRRVIAKSVSGSALLPTADGRTVVFMKWVGAASNHSQQQVFDIDTVPTAGGTAPTTVRAAVQQYIGTNVSWSPDGRYLAWISTGELSKGECFVYDTHNGKIVSPRQAHPSFDPLTSNPAVAIPVWLDSAHLLVLAHEGSPDDARYAQNQLWIVDATSGAARELTTLKGAKIIQIITSDGTSRALQVSGKLLLLAEDLRTFDDSLIEVNSENGEYSRLVSGPFKITVARGSSNSWLISFIREAADVPPDIWLLDVHRHGVERVTHLNPFFDKTPLGEAILIKYNLSSGAVAHAALLLPPSRSAKQRVPLIVYAYGGTNKSRYIHYFGFGEVAFAEPTENMQLLATRGYAVLLPDIPIRVGTPMKDIADGIVSAANAAVRFGYADKERLGIMGHSYGGYSVYATIVSTSMFKAAIARSGFSDWLTFYGEMSDDGAAYAVNLAEMTTEGIGIGASPWAAPDLYPENSPFRYFDRVTTPVLITHGTDDNGVDDYNDKSSFVALRRLGRDVELALYGGADHNEPQWSEANQQDYLERMIGWFDRYLCPERLGDPERTCKAAP